MVDVPARLPAPAAPLPAPALGSGPCGSARAEVDYRCAEAERLSQAAAIHVERLREAKRMLAKVEAQRDADARVRDRRLLSDAKENARRAYRESYARARSSNSPGDVQGAAGEWLREIDRLNRKLELAERRAADVARQMTELQAALPGIELAADAARIAAETAQVACVEARRSLADCEEEAARQIRAAVPVPATPAAPRAASTSPVASGSAAPALAGTAATAAPTLEAAAAPGAAEPAVARPTAAPPAPDASAPVAAFRPSHSATPRGPLSLLLRGERQALLGLTLRLAEETGVEAGRLQLLLLELRQAIAAQALEEVALAFPAGHPFWSQFSAESGRQLAASLAQLGYGFDGRDGWRDDRAPGARELAMAVAHVGMDPRSLRRPAGQAAIDGLWQGTTVLVEDWLAARAPDLSVGRMMAVLGQRGSRLGELWDMWGRLRPLLLPGSTAG